MAAVGENGRQDTYDAFVESMKARTKAFSLRVIALCRALPKDYAARVIAGQLIRSGTSVGANYRAACRARTGKEFTNKIRIVMEEADEAVYWIELIRDAKFVPPQKLIKLHQEANELTAIFTAAHATARKKSQPEKTK